MSRHRKAREASALSRLYRALVAQAHSPSAARVFPSLREQHAALTPFTSPPALVAHLADREVPSATRNTLLAVLITASRTSGAVGRLATALVWLDLWSGLTTLFARERRHAGDDDELLSRIAVHFAEHLARVETARVAKLAATLLLDTRCSLRAEREREGRTSIVLFDDCEDVADVAAEVDFSTLRRDVHAVVGPDADLLLARTIALAPLRTLARGAGVSEDAARKRIARAVDRLREHFNAE